MNPIECGFVVPVWVREELWWDEAWALPNGCYVMVWGGLRRPVMPNWLRPRDPNRADGGDRPG